MKADWSGKRSHSKKVGVRLGSVWFEIFTRATQWAHERCFFSLFFSKNRLKKYLFFRNTLASTCFQPHEKTNCFLIVEPSSLVHSSCLSKLFFEQAEDEFKPHPLAEWGRGKFWVAVQLPSQKLCSSDSLFLKPSWFLSPLMAFLRSASAFTIVLPIRLDPRAKNVACTEGTKLGSLWKLPHTRRLQFL